MLYETDWLRDFNEKQITTFNKTLWWSIIDPNRIDHNGQ